MLNLKSKLQFIIIGLGILSLVVGIRQMLQTRTMILPSWFLVLLFTPSMMCVSVMLGYLTKKITKSKWYILTHAAIFVIVFSSIFYISEYRPNKSIIVPESYVGEVRLFVSNENDFMINKYGVGYIERKTFIKGFYPKIIKGSNDITKQIKEYSKGALATTKEDLHTYEYLTFFVPINGQNIEDKNIEELIKIKAIDTARLYKKVHY
ncbi:hypothetical protein [Pedobacter sp. Hv1]|uniref:hypothetical protein n=1 Tax=Pedobacter sp. Hv1 TaxID=1740090 RepID=UPI0006D89405|nr:hypothetical protein [Pedobacter sp. Hv1]KQC01151.1 hypothetical protein AQF98_10840 [Pedobacter sp. Hv1]